MPESVQGDWGILHRIVSDDVEHHVLRLRIRNVSAGIGKKEIRQALERAGRVYGDGVFPWGNYSILPQDEWLDQEQAAAESISFTDLLDEARGEKRVTLRIPIGLHAALVKTAKGKSFNQFCLDTLSAAIGYTEETVNLTRIAQGQGISVAELTEKLERTAEKHRNNPSAFAERMSGHFGKISGLPAEQIKAQTSAILDLNATPNLLQTIQENMDSLTEEQMEKAAVEMGMPIELMREGWERLKSLPANYFEKATEAHQASTPEQAKDNALLLRDIFRGQTPGAANVHQEDEA